MVYEFAGVMAAGGEASDRREPPVEDALPTVSVPNGFPGDGDHGDQKDREPEDRNPFHQSLSSSRILRYAERLIQYAIAEIATMPMNAIVTNTGLASSWF
jgi:hypothetical protein